MSHLLIFLFDLKLLDGLYFRTEGVQFSEALLFDLLVRSKYFWALVCLLFYGPFAVNIFILA
jgi:hypothetical protein